MENTNTIGIIGGVGPYAGLDLMRKIFEQTIAEKDQHHVSVIHISEPALVPDRTSFLLNQEQINPAQSIVQMVTTLEQAGANVIGIPCITMHSPRIFNEIKSGLHMRDSKVKLLNLVEEVIKFMKENHPTRTILGILSTKGTAKTKTFDFYMSNERYKLIPVSEEIQQSVHNAIYNSDYGLKVKSNPVTTKARKIMVEAAEKLISKGAEIIILGCTEIPLAFTEQKILNAVIVDPNLILARALLSEVAPEKLKPLNFHV